MAVPLSSPGLLASVGWSGKVEFVMEFLSIAAVHYRQVTPVRTGCCASNRFGERIQRQSVKQPARLAQCAPLHLGARRLLS